MEPAPLFSQRLPVRLRPLILRCLSSLCGITVLCVPGCTPVSKSYEIHTPEMNCDEANRYVQDAVLGMGMRITGFRVASPGSPGFVHAVREGARGAMDGTVHIRCEPDGVHIDADQSGIASEHEFERGIFLSVTSRADLVPEREGRGIGQLKKREHAAPIVTGQAANTKASGENAARRAALPTGGVSVAVEPLSGFSTVLDFDADLSAAGILAVRITVTNATRRVYEFDPRDVVLRKAGSRERAYPLTPAQAVERLLSKNRELLGAGGGQPTEQTGPAEPSSASELGDVRTASRRIPERALRAARLDPGAEVTGFVYYPANSYDRARITMIDAATGETEGFLVEF